MAVLLYPFLLLSIIGLILSLIVHGAAVLGLPQPLGSMIWALHAGIFVVFCPAILVSRHLAGNFKRKDFWKVAFHGCPPWMQWLAKGFFGYAAFNFVLCMAFGDLPQGKQASGGELTPPDVFRMFSGHWMAFYAMSAAIIYSAIRVAQSDPTSRCPNGHPVSPSALYCETCGASLISDN